MEIEGANFSIQHRDRGGISDTPKVMKLKSKLMVVVSFFFGCFLKRTHAERTTNSEPMGVQPSGKEYESVT